MGMVDPATLPEMLPAPTAKNEAEGERKIDLSEIIGLPDFDVCPFYSFDFTLSVSRFGSFPLHKTMSWRFRLSSCCHRKEGRREL